MDKWTKDAMNRADKARNFPTGTCPASRHAQMIGEHLARKKPYPMLTEEPDHCGGSILSTVASLWEARAEIERLRAALTDARDALRNDFEPDNQSSAYKRASAALEQKTDT